jgi:hypothetical protein
MVGEGRKGWNLVLVPLEFLESSWLWTKQSWPCVHDLVLVHSGEC